jgi:HAD superfamily hydrolase (TIGR01549 family)
MPIRAVVFDLDGTITEPYFDFDAIREEIGLEKNGEPILEAMEKMTPAQRQRAERILHDHEQRALAASRLNPGAAETLAGLRSRGLPIGILTRNRKDNAETLARRHHLQFDAIVGREDGPVKPDAFGLLRLCRKFGVSPADTLMVGDYLFDLLCAKAAGAVAVWMVNKGQDGVFSEHADFEIRKLDEILQIIDDREQSDRIDCRERIHG